MVSQADLISASTDIMNLGLADSEDGVVRLASAVGALNLDMGVLALTLANDSTARLDSLGLSMEDVTAKKKELIESGFIGDAFDEAVLIALEEKMVLLGDASQTTAGELAIVEAAMADLNAEGKILAATMAGPLITGLANAVTGQNKLNEGVAAGVITTKEWNEIVNAAPSIIEGTNQAIDKTNRLLKEQETGISAAEDTIISYYQGMAEATAEIEYFTDATNVYVDAGLAQAQASRDAYQATQDSIAAYEQGAQFLSTYAEAGLAAAESSRQQYTAISNANEQYSQLSGFLAPLKGDAESTTEAFDNLAVSIVNAELVDAVEAGQLTAEQAAISSVNVQQGLGLIDEAQADQLREAATQFGVIEEAITIMADEMVSAGGVTVEEATKMQEAINLVEEGSKSNGDVIAIMATTGGENMASLSSDFEGTLEKTDLLREGAKLLMDQIIAIPSEKTITIRTVYTTEGSNPGVMDDGAAATATAVSDQIGG
jgi:polyhydroxyalkanoate synthesis regulator phasin